jgi:hypothetical protein
MIFGTKYLPKAGRVAIVSSIVGQIFKINPKSEIAITLNYSNWFFKLFYMSFFLVPP